MLAVKALPLSHPDCSPCEGEHPVSPISRKGATRSLKQPDSPASRGGVPRKGEGVPTIIFDEIDTGVSGDIAGAVARIMCRMAEGMQVVAITHLPQIAARATQHLKVYKHVDDDRTVSRLRQLTVDERVVELATMLSTDPPTPAALQTARELMQ